MDIAGLFSPGRKAWLSWSIKLKQLPVCNSYPAEVLFSYGSNSSIKRKKTALIET